jgi:hypothetical protein
MLLVDVFEVGGTDGDLGVTLQHFPHAERDGDVLLQSQIDCDPTARRGIVPGQVKAATACKEGKTLDCIVIVVGDGGVCCSVIDQHV